MQVQDALAEANAVAQEALANVRTVLSFAAEQWEELRYQNKIGNPDDFPFWSPTQNQGSIKNRTTYSIGFFKAIWNSAYSSFVFGFGFAAMYASLWYGLH